MDHRDRLSRGRRVRASFAGSGRHGLLVTDGNEKGDPWLVFLVV